MADLASLVVRLRTDAREFKAGMRQAETGLAGFTKSIGRAQAAVAALGIVAVAKVAKETFKLGAAAEETASKFATVFGRASDEVDDFVRNFGRAAGLSQEQARDLTATTGAIVQGLGFARQESARFAQEVVKLSGDLASFNNRDTADVARAVAAALTGEREQIKSLGIVIREADVQQKALALSGKATASALTDQERALATLVLLQERSGVAVGDLSRTSKSAANQAKQLAGNIRTLKEELSTTLLPLLAAAVSALNKLSGAAVQSARGIGEIIDKISGSTRAEERLRAIAGSVTTLEEAQDALNKAQANYEERLSAAINLQIRLRQEYAKIQEGDAKPASVEALEAALRAASQAAALAKRDVDAYNLAVRDLTPLEIRADDVQVSPVTTALETLRAQLRQTSREFTVFGNADDAFQAKVGAYRSAISALLETLDPTDARVKALVQEFRDATHQTDLAADATGRLRANLLAIGVAGEQARDALAAMTNERTKAAFDTLADSLETARRQFRQFGDEDALRTDTLDAYRAAIEALTISEGENSGAVRRLVVEYRRLAEEATTVREQLGAEFANFAVAFGDTLGRALTDGKRAFRDFANFVIGEITRIIARAAIFKALTAIFGGSPAGSFGAGVLSAIGAGQQVATPALAASQATVVDLSSMPPATNPLASARDGVWLDFLDKSINHGRTSGFRMGVA